jgi:hypothetical protein
MEVNKGMTGDSPAPNGWWLAQRPLPRAGGDSISPLVWRITPLGTGADPPLTVLWAAVAGGEWVYVPADMPDAELAWVKKVFDAHSIEATRAARSRSLVIGVRGEDLAARRAARVRERLAALGATSCAAVMLEEADPVELKGGRTYQRLTQLRDAGVIRLIFLEANDVPNAEWLIENTAAHAVSLPYGVADQTAAYGLLDIAKEVGTAVLARRPDRRVWNAPAGSDLPTWHLRFCLSDPRIAAAVEPLPDTNDRLTDLAASAATSMSDDEVKSRERLWTAFQEQVPKPPRSRTGHPPEYGA